MLAGVPPSSLLVFELDAGYYFGAGAFCAGRFADDVDGFFAVVGGGGGFVYFFFVDEREVAAG